VPMSEELLLLDHALEIVEQKLAGRTLPNETMPIREALGRTIVDDQISSVDIPPFDKSAMDGYAVLDGDERDEYRLLEIVGAGGVPTQPLTSGTCTKIMTGAPVPQGAGKVVMVENTSETDGIVSVHSHSKAHNICRKAEDISRGDTVLHAPSRIGPLEIANLISVGIAEVKVAQPLRIAILATGDEIVDTPDCLALGKIMNSNGPMLAALCNRYDLQVVSNAIVPDNRDATISAIRDALDSADIVLISGGVSAGDFDFVADAIRQNGLELGNRFWFARQSRCSLPYVPPVRIVCFAIARRQKATGAFCQTAAGRRLSSPPSRTYVVSAMPPDPKRAVGSDYLPRQRSSAGTA